MEHNQSSLMQMQSAFDHFNQHRNTLKMTTGSAELDSLIDSIQEGQFYLFYGKNKAILAQPNTPFIKLKFENRIRQYNASNY